MRNGIYRVRYKAAGVEGSTAILLIDREVIGCDSTHSFSGTWEQRKDWLTADLVCRRHTRDRKPQLLPDIDECHLQLDGPAKAEFAKLRGVIAELPEARLDVEFIWLCEL